MSLLNTRYLVSPDVSVLDTRNCVENHTNSGDQDKHEGDEGDYLKIVQGLIREGFIKKNLGIFLTGWVGWSFFFNPSLLDDKYIIHF